MASSGIPALYSHGHLNIVLLGRSAGPVLPALQSSALCVHQVEPLAADKTRPLGREVNGTIRTNPDVHELHSALYPSEPEREGTLFGDSHQEKKKKTK